MRHSERHERAGLFLLKMIKEGLLEYQEEEKAKSKNVGKDNRLFFFLSYLYCV